MVINEKTMSKPLIGDGFQLVEGKKFVATFHNTSLKRINELERTKCNFEFFNHKGESFNRSIELIKGASLFIDSRKKMKNWIIFFGYGGWCMVNSTTYLCDAYFFH